MEGKEKGRKGMEMTKGKEKRKETEKKGRIKKNED